MHFPRLVHEYLTESVQCFPEKTALICDQRKWTYRELDQQSNLLAHHLIQIGIQRKDRVVVFLDNSAEIVISLYGILKAGAIFVIINGALKPKKLGFILQDSGAKVLITHASKAMVVANSITDFNLKCKIIWLGDDAKLPDSFKEQSFSWDKIQNPTTEQNTDLSLISPVIDVIDLDLAALIYTSGSTGEPKGVMSTHQNMLSAAKSIIQYLKNDENDIILNVLPLSFDYGLYQIIMSVIFGGTVVLEKSFLYIYPILNRIEEEHVTGFPIVPTILSMLLKLKDIDSVKFKSLRYISNTGAALPVMHIKQLRKLLPEVQIYSMFGLTECKRVSYLPPEEIDQKPASVGKPIPHCEVFLLNEQGNEVTPGELGELVVRGANVMRGYWNAPELTAKYFKPGKFPGELQLYSGDYFYRDADGYLYFLGRKDDMIKTKGERVSAREIENVLHEHEAVAEAAVFGVPDEIFGQAIKAVVVMKSGCESTENELLLYCKANLEPFAIPKYIEFQESLPKTANGKIDKKLLKEQHLEK